MILVAATAASLPCHAVESSFASTSSEPTYNLQTTLLLADEDITSQEYIESLGLKPATESQPQITLPKNIKKSTDQPLVQGLVYFAEQQTLGSNYPSDYNDDLLILTVIPFDAKEPILAGAKLPISSVRFPFLFQMYKENLLTKQRDAWLGTEGENQDVIVEARICPKALRKLPCNDEESKRYARGIAKVLSSLPGLEEGEIVRAPASLALQ
jgi:hypothetical protein